MLYQLSYRPCCSGNRMPSPPPLQGPGRSPLHTGCAARYTLRMAHDIRIRDYNHRRDADCFRALNMRTFRDSVPDDEPVDEHAFLRHYDWLLHTLAPHDRKRSRVFVAEIDGEYAGHLWLGTQNDFFTRRPDPWIYDLSVAPEFRGRGVARALHDHAIQWLKERGSKLVGLQVMAHNAAAARLYESLGYKPRAVSMKLDLPESRD
jgi:ribosomal protein S18 acetylase RimI-like enzyme